MIKKIVMATAAIIILAPGASFAKGEGTGCGLGQQVFEGQKGLMPHISAGTTNGLFGNQSFGLSFGTLGCDASKVVDNKYQRDVFVASNADTLSRDIARGEGAHVEALASLQGVEEADKSIFISALQAGFAEIVSAEDMVAAINSTLAKNATLSKYVV